MAFVLLTFAPLFSPPSFILRSVETFPRSVQTEKHAKSLFLFVLFQDGVKQAMNETLSPCPLPAQVQHAYRIGGPVSSLSYGLPLQVLQPRWAACITSPHHFTIPSTQTQYRQWLCPPQAHLLPGCQDPSSWGPAVLCCHQARTYPSGPVLIQRQDQTVHRQTEGDL